LTRCHLDEQGKVNSNAAPNPADSFYLQVISAHCWHIVKISGDYLLDWRWTHTNVIFTACKVLSSYVYDFGELHCIRLSVAKALLRRCLTANNQSLSRIHGLGYSNRCPKTLLFKPLIHTEGWKRVTSDHSPGPTTYGPGKEISFIKRSGFQNVRPRIGIRKLGSILLTKSLQIRGDRIWG
jgi:hypothetical protein